MKILEIEGNVPLRGTIHIGGAKNSAVALLPASILCDEYSDIYNVPNITDKNALIELNGNLTINGKRDVEGTEYYPSGQIEYQGGYKFGARHGNGKEYDKNGKVMLQNTKAKKYYYSLSNASADFRAKVLDNSFEGLDIELNGKEIYSPLIGKFNAYNLLAIYSVAILLGLNKEEVLVNLSAMKSAPGRFDCYRLSTGAVAIVDYAHTPDALENVLKTINEINTRNKGKIFCVVGCGGDRDKSKRPIMASIGQKYANVLVITADNPRTEKIEDIIEDMKQGLKKDKPGKQHFCIPDRREAIKLACTLSQKNDIVLVAGKGHETYQEIENKKHHFDDKEEVLKY